jgi:hypothetical protein
MYKRFVWLLLLPLWVGCSHQERMDDENSVYYWRTEWQLDSTERSFLTQYHIHKVYCRYFDVVLNDDAQPMPNATIAFAEKVPQDLELVPTVFITENCMHQRHEGLARKLVERIMQMNETNDVPNVQEIQIDCDYTGRSRQMYYDFLAEVRQETEKHHLRLSATIRLHQLAMPAPPVDYGVLMLYNTGDPQKFQERNPILDLRDVQPYLRYLADYRLALAAAYPVFLWQRDIYGVRVEHVVESGEILQVKAAVEKKRSALRHTILLYHLDHDNINRYNDETFESIYRH